MGLVDEGRVGTIIVKDMSRLGRDYLKVGMYTEMIFPNADIRFIAINNGVDSANQAENDMTPFINIFNEFYAKDTSRKIRAVSQIAKEITKRHIMNPTAYAKHHGRTIPDNREFAGDYIWGNSTVSHMLSRPEYLGSTVNFKTYRKSYKQKKQLHRDPSEWQIFENTHEAIIDRETYDIVQRIRDGRRRVTPMGEMPTLSGMVFCADCGAKLYQVRGRNLPQSEYMVCATYRKRGKEVCSSHQIRNSVIEEFLLDGIRNVTAYVREHEDEFVEMVTKLSKAETEKTLRDEKRELEQAQTRIHKLDTIIQRLYEDNVEGKISNERFAKMSESYETEQKELEERITALRSNIAAQQEDRVNVDSFIALVRKHTDIRELNAEIIREFVERIEVFQAERVCGKKVQKLRIVWNCIGSFNPPQPDRTGKTA